MALREFQQLVDRAGGRERVLLVSEAGPGAEGEPPRWPPTPPTLLGTFARELFGQPPPPPPPVEEEEEEEEEARARARAIGARQVRVRIGGLGLGGGVGGAGRPPSCALLFVLVRARSLLPPRWGPERRRRLREILRDLRGRLRDAGRPAVVGVAVWEAAAEEAEAEAPGTALALDASSEDASACPPGGCADPDPEAARAQLEALVRRVFRARRPPPGMQETLQAATYRPGSGGPGAAAAEARQAAARALRAALKLRADEAATEKQRLPAFLQCVPWGRPRRTTKGHLDAAAHEFREDTLQDANEGVALSNMTPNGKCEEAHGKSGSLEADGIPSSAALSG